MSSSVALREIFTRGRPLVQQWLEVGEQIAALRDVATAKGLDWSQVKALLKAQIQDELDETGNGKRVRRIVEKAEFASAYADMLGLGNMNEKKYSAELPNHDPATGEVFEPTGFIATLTNEQREQARAYRGEDSPVGEVEHEPAPYPPGAETAGVLSDPLATGPVFQSAVLPPQSTAPEPLPQDTHGSGAPIPAFVPAFLHKDKPYVLRPHCLRPELCGGYGAKHCGTCERASQDSEAA